ncbi:MAG: hypothetical protein WCY09_08635 [Candidatus Omnitrophota bacterium]|jgi:hypothetical protein
MKEAIVCGICGLVCCMIGFYLGCDFRKYQVSKAEKRATQAEANWDRIVRAANKEIGELRDRYREVVARRLAADLVIDRILDVIHDARNKQAERDTMNAGTSASGQ